MKLRDTLKERKAFKEHSSSVRKSIFAEDIVLLRDPESRAVAINIATELGAQGFIIFKGLLSYAIYSVPAASSEGTAPLPEDFGTKIGKLILYDSRFKAKFLDLMKDSIFPSYSGPERMAAEADFRDKSRNLVTESVKRINEIDDAKRKFEMLVSPLRKS